MPDIMNTAQARIVDPLLTSHIRGYTHPQRVGRLLFPVATVMTRGGKRIEFGKESFRLYNTTRAPGAATKRVRFGYDGKPFALEQHALEGVVPFEHMADASRVPGFNLGQRATNVVADIISLRAEYLAATKARDAANYDANHKVALVGTDKWTDGVNSDPKGDVKTGKEAIRASTGQEPNTMILSPKAFSALDDHPKLAEKFKYTSSDSITAEMLAKYFDIERVAVGKAVYAADGTDAFTDVWGTDVVMAYVATDTNVEVPSYGYTYQLDGHPIVEEAYTERNAKSWIYPVTDEFSPELVGAEAGYLIQGAV